MAVHRGLADSLANGFGTVGRGGFYRITGLVPGKYRVFFGDSLCGSGPDNLVPQWFVHASLRSKATVVSVAPGRTTHGISVTLPRDGAISGAVTGPKPAKKPLAGICVQAVPAGSRATPFLAESAASNGSYLIGQLPPGRYRIEFEASCATTGYATQWWRGAARRSDATLVTVPADRTRSGVNAHMTPSPLVPNHLSSASGAGLRRTRRRPWDRLTPPGFWSHF